jgi:hypothetical protein
MNENEVEKRSRAEHSMIAGRIAHEERLRIK